MDPLSIFNLPLPVELLNTSPKHCDEYCNEEPKNYNPVTGRYSIIRKQILWGPGRWINIHTQSVRYLDRIHHEFPDYIKYELSTITCPECHEHARIYFKNNFKRLLNYLTITNDNDEFIGPALWTMEFHNFVNERLNKPLMNWENFYEIYISKEETIEERAIRDKMTKELLENFGPELIKLSTEELEHILQDSREVSGISSIHKTDVFELQ